MRFFFLLLCGLHVGCAHRYVLTPVHQSECDCEQLRLVGDTLVCSTASTLLKFSMDSLSQIERRARLGGTLAFGSLGAYVGVFVGTVFGALAAWSSSSKQPDLYVIIPSVVGGTIGFFQGSFFELIDKKNALPNEFSY